MRAIWTGLAASLALVTAAFAQDDPVLNPTACANYGQSNADLHGCDAAIASETNPKTKSVLLHRRAYMKDGTGQYAAFQSALDDLNAALALWPQNWGALHERAYLEIEFGDPAKAAADLDRQAAFTPDDPQLYQERGLARFRLGDLQGSFEDRDRQAVLEPNSASDRLARAGALVWLGRFDEASKDTGLAETLAQTHGDKDTLASIPNMRAVIARWSAWDDPAQANALCLGAKEDAAFQDEHFVGNCTRAFLDAKSGKDKAAALSQRAIGIELWLQSRTAAIDDFRLAAALDPANPSEIFNLGSGLNGAGRYHEALRYLDAGIAADPNGYAYAVRANAKYELGDYSGAFADAKKSFELKPNELGLTVLGDLAFTQLKDMKAAKSYWMGAYHLGDRDDGLIARLKKVGVDNPDAEPSTP